MITTGNMHKIGYALEDMYCSGAWELMPHFPFMRPRLRELAFEKSRRLREPSGPVLRLEVDSGTLRVWGVGPSDLDAREVPLSETHSLSLSATASPESIAWTIAGKLLPGYLADFEVTVERHDGPTLNPPDTYKVIERRLAKYDSLRQKLANETPAEQIKRVLRVRKQWLRSAKAFLAYDESRGAHPDDIAGWREDVKRYTKLVRKWETKLAVA